MVPYGVAVCNKKHTKLLGLNGNVVKVDNSSRCCKSLFMFSETMPLMCCTLGRLRKWDKSEDLPAHLMFYSSYGEWGGEIEETAQPVF